MREEGIDFQQGSNAFLRCGAPERLQQLADTLTAEDLASCSRKWLARLTPFFTETERKQAGCQHRLFFSQIEFCDNLIFHRRAALDKLGERLLDANRTIGQPNKITVIFGRKVTKQYRGKLQTEIEDIPAQPGDPQSLSQRLYQAIRARPPDPPYRSSRQQRDRLWSEQGDRASSRVAGQALRDQ